jgi:hypothetical protein
MHKEKTLISVTYISGYFGRFYSFQESLSQILVSSEVSFSHLSASCCLFSFIQKSVVGGWGNTGSFDLISTTYSEEAVV